jgi:4-hydroxy-tetrahydrodipicolinate synthase
MIKGSIAALVTPFSEDGGVDYECYERLIEFHVRNGTGGIVVLGTTGEAPTVNDGEAARLIECAVRCAGGRIPVIAGCGANDTERAKAKCVSASRLGADALLVLTPYYNKANTRGMRGHFTACADVSEAPVIIYNVPGRTGCSVTVDDVAELKKHPNICGIKEASGNMAFFTRICALAEDKFGVYCGCDEMNVPALAAGACGIISVLANILPRECAEMCALMEQGRVCQARAIQHRYSALTEALFSEPNPIPIKTAMNELCLRGVGKVGAFRMPLCQMGEVAKARLVRELELVSESFDV